VPLKEASPGHEIGKEDATHVEFEAGVSPSSTRRASPCAVSNLASANRASPAPSGGDEGVGDLAARPRHALHVQGSPRIPTGLADRKPFSRACRLRAGSPTRPALRSNGDVALVAERGPKARR
jgi:hypothetical protein